MKYVRTLLRISRGANVDFPPRGKAWPRDFQRRPATTEGRNDAPPPRPRPVPRADLDAVVHRAAPARSGPLDLIGDDAFFDSLELLGCEARPHAAEPREEEDDDEGLAAPTPPKGIRAALARKRARRRRRS